MTVNATYTEDTYHFTTTDNKITITLDRIRVDRTGTIRAETDIHWHVRPNDGLLKSSDLNLNSGTTIKQWANEFQERAPYDWYALLTTVAKLAKTRYREGDPPIVLADVNTTERPHWFLEPFIQHGGPTVIAAPGGSGKSLFALAVAALVATGHSKLLNLNAPQPQPVLYLDWESDRYSHHDRLTAICSAASIDTPRSIHYRREYAPLVESVTELTKHAARLAAGLVIVDSKGAALHGAPEDAEATLRFFRALRQLSVPVLVVDHVTNEAADQRGGAKRPFGSVYTRNMARNVWMVTKKAQEHNLIQIVMELTKTNDGPGGTRRAWNIHINQDDQHRFSKVLFEHTADTTVTVLAPEDASTVDRVFQLLMREGEPMHLSVIASTLSIKPNTLRAQLGRDPRFHNLSPSGVEGLWQLTVQRQAQTGLPDPL